MKSLATRLVPVFSGEKLSLWQGAAILFFLAGIVLSPALTGLPILDDLYHIFWHPFLGNDDGWLTAFEPGIRKQWHPLTDVSLWVLLHTFGHNFIAYHLVNLFLHVGIVILNWRILLALSLSKRAAWLAAVIYAVHPLAVANVAWISRFKNCLSALFFFGAILLYLHFIKSRQIHYYALALLLFIFALLAKAWAVVLVPVLALAVLYCDKKLSWSELRWLVPFFFISLFFGLFSMEMSIKGGSAPLDEVFGLGERVIALGKSFLWYPLKAFIPYPLMIIHPSWNVSVDMLWNYVPLLLCVVMAFLTILLWQRGYRTFVLLLGYYAATISLYLGIFNVQVFQNTFVFESSAYLALPGLILGWGLILTNLWQRFHTQSWSNSNFRLGVSVGVVFIYMTISFNYAFSYRNVEASFDQNWLHNKDVIGEWDVFDRICCEKHGQACNTTCLPPGDRLRLIPENTVDGWPWRDQ